ncbi:MAG: hypothetical protein JRE23_17865 [Deltaproteobacteria bacterium]|nr:hypothetical protein [Deltaproteobacteria bacterium]
MSISLIVRIILLANGILLMNTAMKKAAGITQQNLIVTQLQNVSGTQTGNTVMNKAVGITVIQLIVMPIWSVTGTMMPQADGARNKAAGIIMTA